MDLPQGTTRNALKLKVVHLYGYSSAFPHASKADLGETTAFWAVNPQDLGAFFVLFFPSRKHAAQLSPFSKTSFIKAIGESKTRSCDFTAHMCTGMILTNYKLFVKVDVLGGCVV